MPNQAKLILVVDNNPEIVSFMVDTVLPHCGYRGVTATASDQALRIIGQQQPDLILLDMELPGINGLDLVERLRTQKIKMPVILMTAHGSEQTAVRAFRLGVRDYLIKPFTANQVSAAIENALYVVRLEEEKEQLTRQLQQRIQELTVLERIGQSVAAVLNLDTLLNRIVETGVSITQADEGLLLLLDEGTDELYLRAAKNLGEEHAHLFRQKVTDSALGEVIRSGRPLRLGEAKSKGNFKVVTGYFVRALLHVPLISRRRAIGVLSVANRTTQRVFGQNDEERLSALANYAVIALENARLHEALKERASQIEAAYAELQEVSRLKAEFVQDISHELRVPLTFIKGYIDLLCEGTFGEIKPEQLEPLNIIAERTERLGRLVSDMLILQRLETERLELVPINLVEMVHAAIGGARAAAQRVGLAIREEIPETLPPVLGDPDQLPRVLDNLLSNAIKFSPKGGTLMVRIRELDEQVNVYISDTGIGMSPNELEHLFARFYRAGAPNNKRIAGTGLGLSIVKAIVEAHGGQVTVQSRKDYGSTFGFSLPKADPKAGLVSPPAPLDEPG